MIIRNNNRLVANIKDGRRLTFYAALYNEPTEISENGTTFTEVILPGAFDDSLKDTSHEVVLNVNHRDDTTFAKRTQGELVLHSDPKGLFTSTWLENDEVKRSVEEGEVVGASFRADNVRYVTLHDGTKAITKANLIDVCLSCLPERPAYKKTEQEVVLRNEDKPDEDKIKSLFRRLRLMKINVSL